MKAPHETTCLVVDDSAVIRKVARRIIEALGMNVSEAEDGSAALEVCAASMPDAILLDWNMPNMDGYTFLQALRRSEGGRRRRSCSAPPRMMSGRSPGPSGPGPTNTS